MQPGVIREMVTAGTGSLFFVTWRADNQWAIIMEAIRGAYMSDLITKLARKKGLGIKEITTRAESDPGVLSAILKNTRSKNDTLRYNCYQILLTISATSPAALYGQWDSLVEMLDSTNNYFKYQAIYLIANLLSADTEDRFQGISEKYFGLISDPSIMIASHLALNAGKIAKAKPELRSTITKLLLKAGRGSRERKSGDLLQSYIIDAFEQYIDGSKDLGDVVSFVKEQLNSGSPKTRKAAKDFLQRVEKS